MGSLDVFLKPSAESTPSPSVATSMRMRVFRYTLGAIIAGAVVWSLLMAAVVVPDDWDAWAQWGPKAKLLALSSGPLSEVKHFVPGSGDYPLLWPAVWAFSGWCAGGWEEQWSKAWGPLFLLLTAGQSGLLASRFLKRREAGWLMAALFVSMPAVPLVASWAYAEAPFWLMLVSATGRLLQWQETRIRRDLLWAGLFLAAAACTKHEGALFGGLAAVWVFMNSRSVRDVVTATFPLAILYGAWMTYVRIYIRTSNHALSGLGVTGRSAAEWMGILVSALRHVLHVWMDPKQWILVLPLLVIGSGWLFISGRSQDRLNLFLPWGFLIGLFGIVIMQGADWSWQLGVAWNRLSIQGVAVLLPVLALGYKRPSP